MSARLYTPEILGLAVSLAQWPARPDAEFHGKARSKTCGSALSFDCDYTADGIADPGLQLHACAIGQASAAIFADAVQGRSREDIAATLSDLERWLTDEGPQPDWPGLARLDAARAYPARHGAILLPWMAALDALPSACARR